ncbi:uncharacterized protein LOC142987732 [Anticarsia gemmatalis]|uniref:uncharacterized protein LOC142987732 n=1 Tax=Anticarsia gemmatalis TaxID=129554 RepID=UPI003F7586A6
MRPPHHAMAGWWCAVACAALVFAAAAERLPQHRDACHPVDADSVAGGPCVAVTAVTPAGAGAAARALVALALAALRARGVAARAEPAPDACAAGAGAACRRAVLRALLERRTHVALLPLPAARPPHVLELRDGGLEELGDAAPPSRLACAASAPAPRSLLDFVDEEPASRYDVARDELHATVIGVQCSNRSDYEYAPEWCSERGECGALLSGHESEARELAAVVRERRLRLRVVARGECLARDVTALRETLPSSRGLLVCSRELDAVAPQFEPLGPPPCTNEVDICPFDPYRLVKVVNARELVYSPTATRILGRMAVTASELRELVSGRLDPAATVARHREWTAGGEVRVAVMIPASTAREAFDGAALRAAATLAEQDAPRDDVDFKVELLDDGCAATQAFKYLTDAPGAEYGALSGVAGPACGAAFADVARQSPGLRLPTLAYTPQAPTPGAALTLLAAGDARLYARAWSALAARFGWRRVAVLSELATRAALDPADLGLDLVVHVELSADRGDVDIDQIGRWAARTAAVRGRVLYVSAEDARVVRAALCAGRGAGLLPPAGAVWLLPAALPPRWLERAPGDAHNCSDAELREVADGHLSVAPAWLVGWEPSAAQFRDWVTRWRALCRARTPHDSCASPSPHAAALYDVLRLWHDALRRLLRDNPAAIDDIHGNATVRSLVRDATASNYSGLTGTFQWEPAGEGMARAAPLVLLQWLNGSRQRVAEWHNGVLAEPTVRWLTPDGSVPDDGTERCALEPLAELLHADCRTAFVALGTLVLLLLAAALGAAAYQCKRRAEREYRRRLAALGLRELGPKPGGLDRWEIPRERVVINRKLGTGAFGTVYGGHALLAEDRGWSAVAVKTLKAGASTEEKLDFLSEAEAMKRFDHKNVVRLLGVVTKTEPVCTVMEFMLYGDLKNYLLARRHLAGEAADEVSAQRLTAMALDAARALSYLAQLRYVHRDVAARNCLVSAHRVVKLADFGMTRLVFDSDYYRFSRKGMLPVRWMAPESLALGVFSPASDVWSFGVLLYEIVTFGSLPFQGLSNAEVLARVKAGHTLDLPQGLKPQLAGLIKSCWSLDYKARPGAAEVAAFLAEWPRLLAPCLDVPLDALALDPDRDAPAPWHLDHDRAEARWVSWAAPASATTDTTYLSADAPPPSDTDSFLP